MKDRTLRGEIFPVTLKLILEKNEFWEIMDKIESEDFDLVRYFPPERSAHTLAFSSSGTGLVILVTLGDMTEETPENIQSIIIHEAVHVWQFVKEAIQENKEGDEIEAYAVQYYSKYLLGEYAIRTNKRQAKLNKGKAKK